MDDLLKAMIVFIAVVLTGIVAFYTDFGFAPIYTLVEYAVAGIVGAIVAYVMWTGNV